MNYPRSPHEKTGGIVYFGRLIDKIRLHAAGILHPDLHQNLGISFDQRACSFLGVSYDDLKTKVLDGTDDDGALAWCVSEGRQPSEEEIEIWNAFMKKRGWNDEASEILARRKKESGLDARDDIQTMFDYIDADEGRAGYRS